MEIKWGDLIYGNTIWTNISILIKRVQKNIVMVLKNCPAAKVTRRTLVIIIKLYERFYAQKKTMHDNFLRVPQRFLSEDFQLLQEALSARSDKDNERGGGREGGGERDG